MGEHRAKQSRIERRHKQRRAEQIQLIWGALGLALVVLLMVQNDLMNVTGVLAVLGVIEVVAKAWKRLGEKVSRE